MTFRRVLMIFSLVLGVELALMPDSVQAAPLDPALFTNLLKNDFLNDPVPGVPGAFGRWTQDAAPVEDADERQESVEGAIVLYESTALAGFVEGNLPAVRAYASLTSEGPANAENLAQGFIDFALFLDAPALNPGTEVPVRLEGEGFVEAFNLTGLTAGAWAYVDVAVQGQPNIRISSIGNEGHVPVAISEEMNLPVNQQLRVRYIASALAEDEGRFGSGSNAEAFLDPTFVPLVEGVEAVIPSNLVPEPGPTLSAITAFAIIGALRRGRTAAARNLQFRTQAHSTA